MIIGLLEIELSLFYGCDWKCLLIMRGKRVSLSLYIFKLQIGLFSPFIRLALA